MTYSSCERRYEGDSRLGTSDRLDHRKHQGQIASTASALCRPGPGTDYTHAMPSASRIFAARMPSQVEAICRIQLDDGFPP